MKTNRIIIHIALHHRQKPLSFSIRASMCPEPSPCLVDPPPRTKFLIYRPTDYMVKITKET
jgi:hypothetical protein